MLISFSACSGVAVAVLNLLLLSSVLELGVTLEINSVEFRKRNKKKKAKKIKYIIYI